MCLTYQRRSKFALNVGVSIDEKNELEISWRHGSMEDWKLEESQRNWRRFVPQPPHSRPEAIAVSVDPDAHCPVHHDGKHQTIQRVENEELLVDLEIQKISRMAGTVAVLLVCTLVQAVLPEIDSIVSSEPMSQNGDLLSEWRQPSFMSIGPQWTSSTTATVTVYSIVQLFSFFTIFDYIENCLPVGACFLPADALHNWSKILTYVMILRVLDGVMIAINLNIVDFSFVTLASRIGPDFNLVILLCGIWFALTDDSRQLQLGATLSQCNTSEVIAAARYVTVSSAPHGGAISGFSILNCRSENSKLAPIRVCKSDTISSRTHRRNRACDRGLIGEDKYTTDAIITSCHTESSRIQTATKKYYSATRTTHNDHPESRVTRLAAELKLGNSKERLGITMNMGHARVLATIRVTGYDDFRVPQHY
ncbi:uncharacterized protein HD556DRAFT_1305641 [Suillus plorans]|uniref:Uncharacterized protein n=1 Tax=Suillus plorans TaxID=116603 RepID=A0A9P7J2N7_9AGAM|nr:uncharacterized protein HD556DRAFT_1305641 [Suillus plorans]KAG1799427.1 hypothetical protein HD556DRAFT_1305641 [Suillus plorans]